MTTDAVARLLCVSRRTVFRMLRRGHLPQPGVRSRRGLLWFRAHVDAWIAGTRTDRHP